MTALLIHYYDANDKLVTNSYSGLTLAAAKTLIDASFNAGLTPVRIELKSF